MAQSDPSKKLKFSEWRPIGVCDDAPAGIQKAQMFDREDFLIVTGPGIDRTNWSEQPEVMDVLNRYATKLAKISTKTKNMKQPGISKISLYGAVMKLAITPTLNRESKDGKLQLFRIVFEDQAPDQKKKKKKKDPLKRILIILLSVLLLLCIVLGIAIYQKRNNKTYKSSQPVQRTYGTSFCDSSSRGKYELHLSEANRILQTRVDDLIFQGRMAEGLKCHKNSAPLSVKERLFSSCYNALQKANALTLIPMRDQRKVSACQASICKKKGTCQ